MATPKGPFEIPGIVRLETGQGGLPRLAITSKLATAEVYLHGAHVTSFRPAGQEPVIWMSKQSLYRADKPIRGGVPICFPWFGPRAEDATAPVHGFARLRDWSVESTSATPEGEVNIVLSLQSDAATRAIWPVDFMARHIITVGTALTMTLEVTNRSTSVVRFEEALHTYLAVGDVRQISVVGLVGTRYLDKVGPPQTREQCDPIIRFTGETDRVYLDTQAAVVVQDPVMGRKIEIAKNGSNATVIWNPWIAKAKAMPDFGDDEWPGMVCVETVNANRNAIELPTGQTHAMTAIVRLI